MLVDLIWSFRMFLHLATVALPRFICLFDNLVFVLQVYQQLGGEYDMAKSARGFAKMKEEGRDDEVREIASKGGQAAHEEGTAHEFTSEEARKAGKKSPTKFKEGDERTIEAAQKGGEARADDEDVRSGKLGKMGAEARWGNEE